jgi:hypothetical protein
VTINQFKLRPARQWSASSMQKRFASEDAATNKPTEEQLAQRTETEQISGEDIAVENSAINAATKSDAAAVQEVVEEVTPPASKFQKNR